MEHWYKNLGKKFQEVRTAFQTKSTTFPSALWPTQHGGTSSSHYTTEQRIRDRPIFCVTVHPLKSPQEVQLPTVPKKSVLGPAFSSSTCASPRQKEEKKNILKSHFRVFSVKRGHQFSKKYSLLYIHSRPASSSESSAHTPDGAFVSFLLP